MPNNRHDVVFFERNGLRHGEFTLNSSGPDLNVRYAAFWFIVDFGMF